MVTHPLDTLSIVLMIVMMMSIHVYHRFSSLRLLFACYLCAIVLRSVVRRFIAFMRMYVRAVFRRHADQSFDRLLSCC